MAKYIMRTMPDLKGSGKPTTYPQLLHAGTTTTRRMAKELQQISSFSTGDIVGLIEAMSHFIATETAAGRSVRIDGIGTFSATLGLVRGKEREQEAGPHRNAASVQVRSIAFRPAVSLVARTQQYISLEREKARRHVLLLPTPEARLAAALEHIEREGFLHIYDYVRLTGLSRTMASLELRALHRDGLLATRGRGAHKVYIKPTPPAPEE